MEAYFIDYTSKPLKYINYFGIKIPVFLATVKDYKVDSRQSVIASSLKKLLRFIYKCLVDGFIESQIVKWIRRYCKNGGNILEIGAGGGKLIKYVNPNQFYTGFDLKILPRAVRKYGRKNNISFFIGDATDIPLPDSSVDYIWSTEVLEHITNIKKAMNEIRRVCKDGALLLISIPNNYCYKYKKKGSHPEHVNNWSYQEFVDFVSPGFQVIEGVMKGYWIPILKKSEYSFQLPFSHRDEFYNTNFFFVLKCIKP